MFSGYDEPGSRTVADGETVKYPDFGAVRAGLASIGAISGVDRTPMPAVHLGELRGVIFAATGRRFRVGHRRDLRCVAPCGPLSRHPAPNLAQPRHRRALVSA